MESKGLQGRRISIYATTPWRSFIATVFVVAAMSGGGLYAWHLGVRLDDLGALGYPGVFLAMFVSGASTFFPNPFQAIVPVAGALWNPLLVGLAAGLGSATGKLLGYAAGRSGSIALAGRKPPPGWSIVRHWLERYGFATILAIAAVPNPIFDAVTVIAGSSRYPIRRFWLAAAVGHCAKYIAYAYLGATARSLFY